MYRDQLASGHLHDRHSEGYYGTAPSLLHGVMARWSATLPAAGLDLEDYTFIDLGCGKGRVLMMASEYPFRAIGGIELSPELVWCARKNLRTWLRTPRACNNVSVLCGGVHSLQFPEGPVALYCFNSFEREMVELLLRRMTEASLRRTQPIDLLYVHPDHAGLVRQTPGTSLLFDAEIPFSAEDAAADLFGVRSDRCCGFRLTRLSPEDIS